MFPVLFCSIFSYMKIILWFVAQQTLIKLFVAKKNVVHSVHEIARSLGLTIKLIGLPGALKKIATIQASTKFSGPYQKLVRWVVAKTIHSTTPRIFYIYHIKHLSLFCIERIFVRNYYIIMGIISLAVRPCISIPCFLILCIF